MKKLTLYILLIFCTINTSAQKAIKFDTTIKLNKAGYRIRCSNKNADKNDIIIDPIGFESNTREAQFEIRGRINKCELDDFNNDGLPDAALYVINANHKGYVIGITSEKNEGMNAILFPDITDDIKLSTGYNGYDDFSLFQGTLLRRFPVFDTADTTLQKRTGKIRTIQYNVAAGDRGSLKFKVLRSFDK